MAERQKISALLASGKEVALEVEVGDKTEEVKLRLLNAIFSTNGTNPYSVVPPSRLNFVLGSDATMLPDGMTIAYFNQMTFGRGDATWATHPQNLAVVTEPPTMEVSSWRFGGEGRQTRVFSD